MWLCASVVHSTEISGGEKGVGESEVGCVRMSVGMWDGSCRARGTEALKEKKKGEESRGGMGVWRLWLFVCAKVDFYVTVMVFVCVWYNCVGKLYKLLIEYVYWLFV